jgi:hypothetical protein
VCVRGGEDAGCECVRVCECDVSYDLGSDLIHFL